MSRPISSLFKRRLKEIILEKEQIDVQKEFDAAERNLFEVLDACKGQLLNEDLQVQIIHLHRAVDMWGEVFHSRAKLLSNLSDSYKAIFKQEISFEELERIHLPILVAKKPKEKKKRRTYMNP